ncbi:MAG: GWxTD domain-containing protein [Acidobacteriota bacterium]|nr:GWxTD domain-containing protein [Blastocatellia bacterium]MDW8413424.1 GWxTD domain-containing protein [Acidobacteriota bacterium]
MYRAWLLVLTILFFGLQMLPVKGFAADEAKKKRKERKVEDAAKIYQRWLETDVAYIITPEERAAFKKLQTDEEREQFIEQFWLRRDPDPDTPENEYREEHYRRIAYANEKFTSGIPGWKTDRGRIYITFGPPDSIESHPAGGPYERPFHEGGGTTSTYPFEIWFYRYLEGVGSGIEIEFVDPTMTGEYRIARNPEEKDALLYVPNAGLNYFEQIGLMRKADRPTFSPGNQNRLPYGRRVQDNPFERLQLYANLHRAPSVKFKDLQARVSDPAIEFDVLPFALRVDFLRVSDNSVVTSFTLQIENSDLSYKNVGGIAQATVNIYARITALSGRKAGIFEDVVEARCREEELPIETKRSSVYQKNVILEPGRYKIDVVVRDVVSGHTGVVHQGFEVPRYTTDKLQSSSLIIADLVESLNGRVAAGQFIFGSNKVRPSVSQRFTRNQSLGIYLQAYNIQIDQMYLKPKVSVEYIILKQGKEIFRMKEDGSVNTVDLDGNGQQITLGRMFPLRDFEPGDYEIVAKITDEVAGQTIQPKAAFTIVK